MLTGAWNITRNISLGYLLRVGAFARSGKRSILESDALWDKSLDGKLTIPDDGDLLGIYHL